MVNATGAASNRLKAGWPALPGHVVDQQVCRSADQRACPAQDGGVGQRDQEALGRQAQRLGDVAHDGAPSTTIGVLLRKAEAMPQNTITSQRPAAPMRAQSRVALRISRPSKPDSSMA